MTKGKPSQRMLPLASFVKWCLATPYKRDRDMSRRNARARERVALRKEIEEQRAD